MPKLIKRITHWLQESGEAKDLRCDASITRTKLSNEAIQSLHSSLRYS